MKKLVIANRVSTGGSGAGNDPERNEFVGKWSNTSAQITEIDMTDVTNTYGAGTIMKVWGSN